MKFLETTLGRLAYERQGNGPEVYLFFHGFGQNRKIYHPFLQIRKENQSFLFIDIFYHGESSWRSITNKLTKEAWKDILLQLMADESFKEFHLIGYSMGGKFSLITYELFPNYIKSLLLMAPDGIKTGFWYNMATFPGILNRVFKHVVFHPDRFFRTIDGLYKIGLLQSSLVKFVKFQMQTRTKRAQVYFTWNVFKPMQPDLGSIIKMLRLHQQPIILITGTYDKMVTSENLDRFSSKIPHLKNLELPSGHNTLVEDTFDFIKNSGEIRDIF
ncbi:alpha/beta fold hydrolase [Mongoliibacter ruber]|uniref:Pimeloyl-ACP methyl ester carboxylesterase n=1 Tax=Mongoliibacter ruber TaxID=1750599 RepID=A0A2T0WGT4_9BACT|nr:alpha/beta hydrolase [Mongoliibacter ruber]PRY85734.1 pimeloyl-ACP methyl ester carboxylesterase [Mongoliibacter ruber]